MGEYYINWESDENLISDYHLSEEREWIEPLQIGRIIAAGFTTTIYTNQHGYWSTKVSQPINTVEDYLSGRWVDDHQAALEAILRNANRALNLPSWK